MPLFGKKKSAKELAEERAAAKKREEIERVVERVKIETPTSSGIRRVEGPVSSEYEAFLRELNQPPTTYYEKGCAFSEKILKIKIKEEDRAKMLENIKSSYIIATPEGVYAFTFLSAIAGLLLLFLLFIFNLTDLTFGLFIMTAVFGFSYYIYNYPKFMAETLILKMSSETVLAILYMVIYMRTSPNIEGALKFAAQNLPGPLGMDLKKLVWDIEVGTYSSANEALTYYIDKWKEKNSEFAEALHTLKGSAVEEHRREMIYQEAVNIILNGTRERARHYAAGLRMPMMLIHAMGVLLPVMGLVLFPIVMIFMSDIAKPGFIAFGYDILLPTGLFLLTSHILSKKPPTFSQPDISKLKGVPPLGKMSFGNKLIPLWPIALAIIILFLMLSSLGINSQVIFTAVNFSVLGIFGIALGIAVYCFLDSTQKMKARKAIERIEEEFSVALFQLGNALSTGIPIEAALQKARDNLKGMKIAEFFDIILMNIQKLGYTFEQAIFDKEVGAIWYYPSKLIESTMSTIIESSRKSISAAADSMITISNYLKNVHEVKEEINTLLGETVSSMKFLSTFLAPMIAGVTVTMAVVIMRILTKIGDIMPSLTSGEVSAQSAAFIMPWGLQGGQLPISAPQFQFIIGIYMIELGILLSMFINRIQYGDDAIGERSLIAVSLIFASIVYAFAWLVTYSMFGSTIEALLMPV